MEYGWVHVGLLVVLILLILNLIRNMRSVAATRSFKDMWKDSPEVTALMKRENLKDEHEVQSYFVRRMEKFINSRAKRSSAGTRYSTAAVSRRTRP